MYLRTSHMNFFIHKKFEYFTSCSFFLPIIAKRKCIISVSIFIFIYMYMYMCVESSKLLVLYVYIGTIICGN